MNFTAEMKVSHKTKKWHLSPRISFCDSFVSLLRRSLKLLIETGQALISCCMTLSMFIFQK